MVTKVLPEQSYRHTIVVSIVIILFAALIPLAHAHAGIFSFVSSIFKANAASDVPVMPKTNSQNMHLLRAAVNPDPNPSKGGGDITIVGDSALVPEAGPSGTLANIEKSTPKAGQISIYVVREGDSLSQIAEMFGVSKNTIIWANDIKRGSLIATGQTLVILPVSGVTHVAVAGDTLESLAKKYGGNVEEITSFNSLEVGTALTVGDEIIIPDGEIAAPPVSRVASGGSASGGSVPSYSGYFMRPVDGVKTQGIHGYNGVDIAAAVGAPVIAAASGEVLVSREGGWNGGYGSYIVIEHSNGTQTLYAHNSENIVSVGDWVEQGQVIGYVGSTGKSTGPHVHFEVRGAKNPF